jgi:hypothetical protein
MSSFQKEGGYIVISVLVFGTIFVLLGSVLVGFIFTQNKASRYKNVDQAAFEIAEAGLDYYKWFLAHYPEDYQNGTGQPGPYVVPYEDPEGGTIGEFELSINPVLQCGEPTTINIDSTGRSFEDTSRDRVIHAQYARPSVAEYAYILNANVWAGADRIINGRYHSNGGIRMDGTNDSTVSSAQETWLCTSQFGCSGGGQTRDGVFGAGSGSNLWRFPLPQIDFVGITTDLVNLKSLAQAQGRYFARISHQANRYGYHLVFQSNGTFNMYRVTGVVTVPGSPDGGSWVNESHIISSQQLIGNYSVPSSCSVVFVEDKLWVDGTIDGKFMLAAARVADANAIADVILPGNLVYETQDGTDGLTVISDGSILLPLTTPDDMTINGIFIAQSGRFGRNHYSTSQLSSSYDPYVFRNSLTVKGTIVSHDREGTKWVSGSTPVSGFLVRTNTYDRKLAQNPPPFTPYISDEYRFIEWTDEN